MVQKYTDDSALSWEERYKRLEDHHIAETTELVGKLTALRATAKADADSPAEVVGDLNALVWDAVGQDPDDDAFLSLVYETSGTWEGVSWLGTTLWSSENDERREDVGGDRDREPLRVFLLREMRRLGSLAAETALKLP